MKKTIAFVAVVLLTLAAQAQAITVSNPIFKVNEIITNGGGLVNSTDYEAAVVIGDTVAGTSSGEYNVCYGTACADLFTPRYAINIGGKLVMTNERVSNMPVEGRITYLGNYTGKSATDEFGNFNVQIEIPEYLYDKPFTVAVYVESKIKAIYECTYNTTSKSCD